MQFSNPIGLAAGFDRDGRLLPYSDATGFGFIEIGTVNIKSNSNNNALDVRQQIIKAAKAYQNRPKEQLWGISLGSLNDCLDIHTVSDYVTGMILFWNHVDYLVINLSRPDSAVRQFKPDLVELSHFLHEIKMQHQQLTEINQVNVPIVIKIAVDYENNEAITSVLSLIERYHFDAVILAFEHWPDRHSVITYLHKIKASTNSLSFIVVGGIRTMTDAKQILDNGASLVQIYTGLVDQGPLATRNAIGTL